MSADQLVLLVDSSDVISANGREHWAALSRRTRALRLQAATKARLERLAPVQRARIEVRVGWPDKRRRDVANISPTVKAMIDGLVDAGVLPDDSDAHLVGPDLRPYFAGIRGSVLFGFTIYPLEVAA